MAWARIDDQLFMHPKIRKAGPQATLLHIAALTYCNQQLTDGFIPDDVLPMIGMFAFLDPANAMANADHLLSTGLWDVVPGGYQIHDYLEYNMSKEQITEMKEARKEAGKRGAASKNAKYPGNNDDNKQKPGKWLANAKQVPQQMVGARSTISHTHTHNNILTTTTGSDTKNFTELDETLKLYSNNIGVITPIISDTIKDAVKTYTSQWVNTAIQEAVNNGVTKWAYIQTILERWHREGFQSRPVKQQQQRGRRIAKDQNEDYRRYLNDPEYQKTIQQEN